MATIGSILRDAVERAPADAALLRGGRALSFADLADRVARFRTALVEHGARPGDHVALLAGNRPGFTFAHYAVASLGAVVVPINPNLRGHPVGRALAKARVRIAVADELGLVALNACGHPLASVLAIDDGGAFEVEVAGTPLLDFAPHSGPDPSRPDGPGVLFFTSGTTGVPKGILLRHEQALRGLDLWAARWGFSRATRSLMAAPCFHVVYNPLVLGAHRRGGAAVFAEDLSIRWVLHAVEESRATVVMGNPALMLQMIDERHARRSDVGSLDTIIFGAAPTPAPVVQALAARFPAAQLFNCYGLTETSSALACLGGAEVAGREASVGRPHDGVEVAIRDATGAEIGTGRRGEVCVRGPNVITAYFEAPEVDAQRFRGGWLRTGDVGYLDADGYLYLLDRSDDLINVAGEKVYPREVEDVLFAAPEVLDAAVVGLADPKRGQVVQAFVVPREGESIDVHALRRLCILALPPFCVPRRFQVLERIPRNPTGKVLRSELAK